MSLRRWEIALLTLAAVSLLLFALARTIGARATAREGLVSRIARPGVAFWGEDVEVEVNIDADPLPQPPGAADINPIYAALVIDRSGSMAGQPLAEARFAAADFVDLMDLADESDAATIVAFDDFGSVLQAFSQDRGDVVPAIQSIVEGGGTDISAGLSLAVQQFARNPPPPNAHQLIILLSDGVSNLGTASPITAADQAKSQGIRVATVALGDADRATLAQIASSPDDYFETTDPTALLGIYSDIAATVVGSVATSVTLMEQFNDQDFTLASELYRAEGTGNQITWELPFVGRRGRSVGYTLEPEGLGYHPISLAPGSLALVDSTGQAVAQPTPTGPRVLVLFPVWLLFIFPLLALLWLLYRLLTALLDRGHRLGPVAKPVSRPDEDGRPVKKEEPKKPDGATVTHGKSDKKVKRPPPRS